MNCDEIVAYQSGAQQPGLLLEPVWEQKEEKGRERGSEQRAEIE